MASDFNINDLEPILVAWEQIHPNKGSKLRELINKETENQEKIKAIWLDICTTSKNSKCEFMEQLLMQIEENSLKIECPIYIKQAIEHVIGEYGEH